MTEQDGHAAEIVRDLAVQAATVKTIEIGGRKIALLAHDGEISIEDLERFDDNPSSIREKVELQDAKSLIAYVNAFKDDRSRVFFDNSAAQFVAILDYPPPNEPAWGDHTATLKLKHSEEWIMWFDRNSKPYGQVGFGRFIEENAIDVVKPDGATLLEMVMNFEAHKSVAFREATRLRDGRVQFAYSEEMKTGDIEIPDSITIKIPVFYGQEPREVLLRFRYRIEDQKLQLSYEFVRAQRIINEAAAEIVALVASETSLPVHMGKRAPLTK